MEIHTIVTPALRMVIMHPPFTKTSVLAVLFATVLGAASPALAACTKPDGVGVEGELLYNSTYKVMQFCNGTDWVAMAGGVKGGGGSAAPAGAVVSFALEECPEGWTAYAPLSGRFIRGKCITGQPCNDPSGVRAVGSVQADEIKSHTHTVRSRHGAANWNGGSVRATDEGGSIIGSATSATGGDETRPKNVTLLYCRKDD